MKFNKLEPKDYQYLKKYFENQKYNLCPYSLSSIIAWANDEILIYWGIIEEYDSLIIYVDFASKRYKPHLIMPISPTKEYSPSELHQLLKNLGFEICWFAPQSYIEKYDKEELEKYFIVEEQTAYSDYVYLKDDLAELKGNKFSKKRNLIKQFEKAFVNEGFVSVEFIKPSNFNECSKFLEDWCKQRNCDKDANIDLACEKQAALNALKYIDSLDFKGLLLKINGKINAFGVMSKLTSEMGVLHFEKAFGDVKGLYQYFDRECSRQLFNGYKYINKESDMDEEGLAQAKQSYHPIMKLKSYELILSQ
ncbi:MAG: DUF2156 domain-containing protein [Desulfobacterales bacterium]|nr:DUF2156 domain-containing protein [Desulfobacterales bacterium]